MPRKPTQAVELVEIEMADSALKTHSNNANQLAQIQEQTTHAAQAIATQIGYEGALTVGALEDEIRFYQRRTVEACLELGKRLLILKELTPHGEFEQRIALLGFEKTKAHRFMKAVSATAKSCNLQLLSTQVKSMGAFMEIIMLDDDVLEDLSQLDDIGKMCASELRAKVRELTAEQEATEKVLSDKQAKITRLERAAAKKVVALTDWPAAFEPLFDQVDAAHRAIEKAFSDLREAAKAAMQVTPDAGEEQTLENAFIALATKLQDAYNTCGKRHEDDTLLFDKMLGNWAPPAAE